MRPKLKNKFIRVFIAPLCCGIFISIILSTVILLYFVEGLSSDNELLAILKNSDDEKTKPMISDLSQILFRRFQMPINMLLGFKNYYEYLSNNLDLNNIQEMKNFINKYSFNSLLMYQNYTGIIDEINSIDNNSTFLNYGNWFIDKTIVNVDQLDITAIRQIYLWVNMHLLIGAHFKTFEKVPSTGYDQIYAGFPSSKLFTSHPINALGSGKYENYQNMSMPSWCRNGQMEVPDYYYFECRPWYVELKQLYHTYNLEVMISTPYKTIYKSVEIAVCVQFDDYTLIKTLNPNKVVFCVDLVLSDLMQACEQLNNWINGYLFVTRIESDTPIYYPNIKERNYGGNLMTYEFDLNIEYFNNEIVDYSNVLQKYIANMNDTSQVFQDTGTYQKNGYTNSFNLTPILFHTDENSTITQHFLNIVHISQQQTYSDMISPYQKQMQNKLFYQLVILVILGGILNLVSRFVITSIADNIVKPIKMMKKMLVGIKNKNLEMVNQYQLEYEENKISKDEASLKLKDEEADEDDYVDIVSKNIENLSDKMLKLKNVFLFTQNASLTVEKENLLNYVFARQTFNEMKNKKGKLLCDSNVGNLALKCKKYDKAIFHLLESIKDLSVQNISLARKTKKSKKSLKQSIKLNKKFVTNLATIDNIKKKFLESRYPKILYSFKKFYKYLNKLLKKKNIYDNIIGEDLYSLTDYHSLEQYEKCLEDYKEIAFSLDENTKSAEALLEINEFYLNFVLKPSTKTTLKKNEEELKFKEKTIDKIINNFQVFDKIIEDIMSNISLYEYFKRIIDMIEIANKDSLDIIETPIYVLRQKGNYIKGKFAFYCKEYSLALKFFNESKKTNVICHAVIIKNSIKKVMKIVTIINKEIDAELEMLSIRLENIGDNFDFKKKTNEKINELNIKKEKSFLYLCSLEEELGKYVVLPKDIAVLIDFSSPAESEKLEKKISQSIAVGEQIFKNFTTSEDRFTLFSYTSHANPLINLGYKNLTSIDFIYDQFKNISNKKNFKDYTSSSSPNLIQAVETVSQYLTKKSISADREKLIIAITEDLSTLDRNFILENDLQEKLFQDSENTSLIVIKLNKFDASQDPAILRKLKFNKSGLIEGDKLDNLKKKMRMVGNINDDVFFMQEKYDNKVKNQMFNFE